MKIRTGFVSNSSSSSFTLCVPIGSTEEEIRAIIEKEVGEMKGFFLSSFRKELINTIMECKGDKIDIEKELKYEQDWIDKNPDSETEELDRAQVLFDKKLDCYRGSFSDNGYGPMQYLLCYLDFEVEREDFFMHNKSR